MRRLHRRILHPKLWVSPSVSYSWLLTSFYNAPRCWKLPFADTTGSGNALYPWFGRCCEIQPTEKRICHWKVAVLGSGSLQRPAVGEAFSSKLMYSCLFFILSSNAQAARLIHMRQDDPCICNLIYIVQIQHSKCT